MTAPTSRQPLTPADVCAPLCFLMNVKVLILILESMFLANDAAAIATSVCNATNADKHDNATDTANANVGSEASRVAVLDHV